MSPPKGFHTSNWAFAFATGSVGSAFEGFPCGTPSRLELICIATFSIAIRRLQGRDDSVESTRSPLTLDCVARVLPTRTITQDTLSRRRFLFGCQRTVPRIMKTRGEGGESYLDSRLSSRVLRVGRSPCVERKGIEPLTPGLQSRCSPS